MDDCVDRRAVALRGARGSSSNPHARRNPSRNSSSLKPCPASKWRPMPSTIASTAGSPRATANAGGSITVTDRTPAGRRAAASRHTMPP